MDRRVLDTSVIVKIKDKSEVIERIGSLSNGAFNSLQKHIGRYVYASQFTTDKVVLDIACGIGYGSNYLKTKGAKCVVGGDISKEAVKKAGMCYEEEGLFFICLNAAKLPFSSNIFDVIVSFETIEHISEYKKFLSECKRVLKKDGVFICSTPNKDYTSPKTEKPLNPHHVKEFYPKEFYDLLNEYFADVVMYGQDYQNKITTKLINIGIKTLSNIPNGDKLKNFIKRFILRDYRSIEVTNEYFDEILVERYKLRLVKKSLFRIPSTIIALAKVSK